MVMISFVLWLLSKNCLLFKIWTNFEYFDKPGSVERPQVHSQQVIIYSYRHFTRPRLLPRVTEPDPLSNNTFYALSSHFYIFYKLTGDDLVLNMTFYDADAHKNWREFANSVSRRAVEIKVIYPRTHSNLNQKLSMLVPRSRQRSNRHFSSGGWFRLETEVHSHPLLSSSSIGNFHREPCFFFKNPGCRSMNRWGGEFWCQRRHLGETTTQVPACEGLAPGQRQWGRPPLY